MKVEGTMIAQSNTILRFVGRNTNLYPKDPIDALKVDELLESTEELIKLETIFWNEQGFFFYCYLFLLNLFTLFN